MWKTGDKWYMTFGVSSAEKRGQMWLFSSDDMVRWTYERVLFEHPDPNVFMLECPDFFPIKNAEGNEKWVIGFSAMGAKASGFMNRNVSNAGYMIDLHTAPVAEMDGLRENTTDFGTISLGVNGEQTIADDAEAVEIEMTIDLNASTAERAGLKIHATEDGAYTYVAFDDQIGRVVIDRQAAAQGDRGYRTAPLSAEELASGELKLRVFVDRGCVEVYVNDGRQAMSSFSYASEGPRAIKLVAESGTLEIKSLKLHTMKSIGLE